MASQSQSPFTNTRLMLAGVICGAVAALMGFLHIKRVEDSKVGEKVTVYYVRQRVATNQPLAESYLGKAEVSKDFYDAVPRLVTLGSLNICIDRTPTRTLLPGEPLLSTAFEAGAETATLPDIPPGCKERAIRVDSQRGLGQSLDVGAIVSLVGNFRLGEDPNDRNQTRPLRLLQRVQVRLINGLANPTDDQKKNAKSITIVLGDKTAQWLTFLERTRMEHDFTIEREPATERASEPNKEIPADVLELLQTRFPGVVTGSAR